MHRGRVASSLALVLSLLLTAAAFADSLWIGNDTRGLVFRTTLTGAVLKSLSVRVTGAAFDGTFLYFSDTDGTITKRTADGATVLDTFRIAPALGIAEDMAWDPSRQRLWRITHGSTLERIDPVTQTRDQVIVVPTADPIIQPRGGLGIAYDSNRDVLYASFCRSGCATLLKGLILVVEPDSGAVTSELFRTDGFATGGLAHDPATDTLWVGDVRFVRNMTLSGTVLSSFLRPQPAGFVDGLEFVAGPDLPPFWPAGSALTASNIRLTSAVRPGARPRTISASFRIGFIRTGFTSRHSRRSVERSSLPACCRAPRTHSKSKHAMPLPNVRSTVHQCP